MKKIYTLITVVLLAYTSTAQNPNDGLVLGWTFDQIHNQQIADISSSKTTAQLNNNSTMQGMQGMALQPHEDTKGICSKTAQPF